MLRRQEARRFVSYFVTWRQTSVLDSDGGQPYSQFLLADYQNSQNSHHSQGHEKQLGISSRPLPSILLFLSQLSTLNGQHNKDYLG